MSVPTYKTVIIIVTMICCILINNRILKLSLHPGWIAVIILTALVLMFIPVLPDSAWKVWLYYLPLQLFDMGLSTFSLYHMKKSPDQYAAAYYKKYRLLLIWTFLFSIFILLEDSFVIFNVDVYSDILVRINNRSISEDVMSIGYACFALVFFIKSLSITKPGPSVFADTIAHTQLPGKEFAENFTTPNTSVTDFYNFCKKYQLTVREEDKTVQ